MSQENVELVRRAINLVNPGDFRLVIEEMADDFEMDWSNSIGPLRGVYRGKKQATEFLESFLEAWDEVTWDMREVIDLDADQVLVVNRIRMRGRASHANVDAIGTQVWTIRDGKLGGVKLYQSKAEALEAVGLSE